MVSVIPQQPISVGDIVTFHDWCGYCLFRWMGRVETMGLDRIHVRLVGCAHATECACGGQREHSPIPFTHTKNSIVCVESSRCQVMIPAMFMSDVDLLDESVYIEYLRMINEYRNLEGRQSLPGRAVGTCP